MELEGLSVADVMLAMPKTLPGDTTVADARAMLANPHVQMLLLTDGAAFRGAVTGIPDDADPSAPALEYADPATETIDAAEPAEAAFARSSANPYRRLVVLDGEGALEGLVCLNARHTGFCSSGSSEH